jgi:hypothetical protein
MTDNRLEFDWTELEQCVALLAALNKRGVPYTLCKDKHAIAVNIKNGY